MNKIKSKIVSIKSLNSINQIEALTNGVKLVILTLDLPKEIEVNQEVDIVFKESEVAIAKENISHLISFNNVIEGEIIDIERGELLTYITLNSKVGVINALITTKSLDRLNFKLKDIAFGFIKTNELSLMR